MESNIDMVKNIEDRKKDEALYCAMQISKYAFALCFYSKFHNSSAEIHHTEENLRVWTDSLLRLIRRLERND